MSFQDGLGQRRHGQDAAGNECEILCLRKELADVPSFEFALRERVSRLANFRHPSYGRVRSVERTADAEHALTVTSDRTPGLRLSELLAGAQARQLPIDIGSSLCVIRQMVSAVAILHETARDAAHGALAPERLLVTPNARLIVVDYALGSALEQLLYSRDRYWIDLRVALPRVAGLPRFDHLADVTQIGVVALALILGRPLRDDEYPGKLAGVLADARAVSINGEPEVLPQVLIQWLERATQLDPRNSFPSAIDARVAFDKVVDECGYEMSPARLSALLSRYRGPVFHAPPSFSLSPSSLEAPSPSPPSHVEGAAASLDRLEPAVGISIDHPRRGRPGGLVAATAVAAVLVGSGATLAARRFLSDKQPTATTGTLILKTDPSGAQASVDGATRGVTPLTITLAAGPHSVALRGAHGSRDVSVMITAGAQLAQYVDLPKEAAAATFHSVEPLPAPMAERVAVPVEETAVRAGWLAVTGRFDVQVFEQGKLLGSSESDRIMVEAGHHDLELVNEELGYLGKRSMLVAVGKVANVMLDQPKGSIALNAVPWAEVWIDGDKIGETPIGNVAVPIGGHDVVFRHPDLGEQRHRVTVTLKSPARLSVDLRQK